MSYSVHTINGLEKVLHTISNNLLEAKMSLFELKRKMFAKKGELDSLVQRAARLIRKTRHDYDATELVRQMRNRSHDI